MVNTFLTSPDYRISASNLDSARLGKQRVEAYQILLILQDFDIVRQHFDMPLPTEPLEYASWIKEILSKYKATNKYLFCYEGQTRWLDKDEHIYEPISNDKIILRSNHKVFIAHPRQTTSFSFIPRNKVKLPGDRIIKFGFANHPAVRMWLCHNDSLRLYINAHIEEWISRGNKNNMELFAIENPEIIPAPSWTQDPIMHQNHKAALYRKEVVRKETPWYQKKDDFKDADIYYESLPKSNPKSSSDFSHYIWPYAESS